MAGLRRLDIRLGGRAEDYRESLHVKIVGEKEVEGRLVSVNKRG